MLSLRCALIFSLLGLPLASLAAPDADPSLARQDDDGDGDGGDDGVGDDEGAGDDDGDGRDDDAEEEPTVDPEVAKAVAEVLTVRHSVTAENVVSVTYPFSEAGELVDFAHRGFDKVDVIEVFGAGGRQEVGLELGAGSRGTGQLIHGLNLNGAGDFEIEGQTWSAYTSPSAVMCIVLSKKVGVYFGQTIVKPKSMRPYNKRSSADNTVFREERTVTFKITWKDNVLTVRCNGRLTDKRTFKKGELKKVRFGVIVRNMRLVLINLRIRGELDLSKL